ncbi:MAG: MBL fold metallo-hydrolase [Gemmatimonadota bacterium]
MSSGRGSRVGSSGAPRELGGRVRVCTADNAGPLTLDGTRSYLVGGERCALIDPGPDLAGQLERLQRLAAGRRVESICLSHAHPDHAAAAERAARAFGVRVHASSETLHRLGIDGEALDDGDPIEVDGERRALTALATPGHSHDHLCFWRSADRLLFTGDLVLGSGTTVILHPDGEMGAYLASLTRLLSLRPRRILPGHGEPVENPMRLLNEYRTHRLERERQIAESVRRGARSVAEIRRRLYGELEPALQTAAEASIRAHLAHLAAKGMKLPRLEGHEPR